MPAISASAPGKIILFGEHAVVYGRPAIAAPVSQVQAKAVIMAEPRGSPGDVRIQAPNIGLEASLVDLPADNPLAAAIRGVSAALDIPRLPACIVRVTSTIPVASGLGSGTAVTVAIIRALSTYLGHPLPAVRVSALAFEVEKLHHGTPSGIDNTVVTYSVPVFFIRGQALQTIHVKTPFTLVIGDTGISSPTSSAVTDVRRAWVAEPERFERLFDAIGEITQAARQAVEDGHPVSLGPLMERNHALLREIGVSSLELDNLVEAASAAGALGAKLSGGGRGGNMIALVTPEAAPQVAQALRSAGATRTIVTEIRGG